MALVSKKLVCILLKCDLLLLLLSLVCCNFYVHLSFPNIKMRYFLLVFFLSQCFSLPVESSLTQQNQKSTISKIKKKKKKIQCQITLSPGTSDRKEAAKKKLPESLISWQVCVWYTNCSFFAL